MSLWKNQLQAGQKYLQENDAQLARLIQKYGDCTIQPHSDYYSELNSSIVGQQLSVKAADTIWKRVLLLFDNTLPTPEQLAHIDTELLRSCGVSYSKIRYMKDLANHILDGRLDLNHLASQSNEKIIKELVAVKGIGNWSAHMFMIFSLGRLDILPVGDLGIQKSIAHVYGLPELPNRETVEAIALKNHWAPYQSIASWYLRKNLDNKPSAN